MATIVAPIITSKCLPRQDDSQLILKVLVGDAQLSEASYSLKPTVDASALKTGSLENNVPANLGIGAALVGQRLSIYVTVAASLGLSTHVEFTLDGGQQDLRFTNSMKANEIGDVVLYLAHIKITKT